MLAFLLINYTQVSSISEPAPEKGQKERWQISPFFPPQKKTIDCLKYHNQAAGLSANTRLTCEGKSFRVQRLSGGRRRKGKKKKGHGVAPQVENSHTPECRRRQNDQWGDVGGSCRERDEQFFRGRFVWAGGSQSSSSSASSSFSSTHIRWQTPTHFCCHLSKLAQANSVFMQLLWCGSITSPNPSSWNVGGPLSRSIAQEQKRHILGDHRGARIRYARFFSFLKGGDQFTENNH